MNLNRQLCKIALTASLMLTAWAGASAFPAQSRADSSRLATGTWVRVKVSESGIYAITAADARNWGLGDLASVHVYGFGGAPLSEALTDDIPDDLPQVPVLRTSDRLLFYAQGPTTWQAASDLQQVQVQHPYATEAYYFVTSDASAQDAPLGTSAATPTSDEAVTTITGRAYHEQELANPGETGRHLLGEDFQYNKTQQFSISLEGAQSGAKATVLTHFAAKTSGGGSRVSVSLGGTTKSAGINDVYDLAHDHYNSTDLTQSATLQGATLAPSVTYSSAGSTFMARLDYITVNYDRPLALTDGHLYFGLASATSGTRYRLGGATSDTHVWDVTSVTAPVELTLAENGDFTTAQSGRRELVAFSAGSTFPSPTLDAKVANQNLHGQPTPDMIIITPSAYRTQAQRIATLHEANDSMRVLVVEPQQVYNEFSSGTPDFMAYRMLCKLFYDRGTSTDGHKLGYLLLFGGGSFDNRQLSAAVKNVSYPMLLTWQSDESDDEEHSFTSDDILAVLADGAGASFWYHNLDIAVGRMPVKSLSEARTAVDKLIKYVSTPSTGSWKTNILDVADDEDNAVHMSQADEAVGISKANGGEDFNFNKVYIDAFTAVSSGAGRTYPSARDKMFRLLNEGVLWWNYTGHASPNNWTADGILMHNDITQGLYYQHLPILYAATCEFCRFDATATSGGEEMFLNSRGGAIALVTTPRLVYVSLNGMLHNSVARYVFARDAKGLPLRLGDIVRLGKNNARHDDNNSRYFVFGDPAMRPAAPTLKVQVTSINGQPTTQDNMPIFQARQSLTFKGQVVDATTGQKVDFNGPIISTLYDSEQSVVTHGYGEGKQFVFQDRANRLAVSIDTVKGGEFSFKMTVPSEVLITDNYSPALLSLYAYQQQDGLCTEAMGADSCFYIYGYDDDVQPDTIGPRITYLGLNSQDFKDGQDVNESPLVIATMTDESGINLSTSGIGHSMTIVLDDDKLYDDVSSYFTPMATEGEGSSGGTVNYALSGLTNGNHTLKFKVWDVFNNSSESTINFNVMAGLKPEISDVYCDANPASVEANFYVRHNRPDATLNVRIDIYDLMGRLVWSTTQTGRSDMFTSFPVTWNLTDQNGTRVQRGIYVYRAAISTDGVQEATKARKIAVTAQ